MRLFGFYVNDDLPRVCRDLAFATRDGFGNIDLTRIGSDNKYLVGKEGSRHASGIGFDKDLAGVGINEGHVPRAPFYGEHFGGNSVREGEIARIGLSVKGGGAHIGQVHLSRRVFEGDIGGLAIRDGGMPCTAFDLHAIADLDVRKGRIAGRSLGFEAFRRHVGRGDVPRGNADRDVARRRDASKG